MRRIAWIDPLRALAAGLVLVSHVAFWSGASSLDGIGRLLARGDVGVACFFAVSAYLLTRGACHGSPLPPGYARKRLARIMPAYLVTLFAVFAATLVIDPTELSARAVIAHLTMLQAFANSPLRGFTQAWSLTTEITFYALVPVIAGALRRCRRTGTSPWPVLVAVATIGIVVQALSASSGVAALGSLSTSVIGHAAWFAVGIAVALLDERENSDAQGAIRRGPRPTVCLAWAAVAYVAVSTPLGGPLHLETPGLAAAGLKEAFYALIAGLLLWAAVTAPAPRASWASELAASAGEISYGVFLWHVLVLDVLFAALHLRLFHAPFPLVLIVTLVVSVALARLSWLVVERPCLRWAHRAGRR